MPEKNESLLPQPALKVLLIGAGEDGLKLLQLFKDDVSIIVSAVVDTRPNAVAFPLAKELGIQTSTNYRNFITDSSLDMIINVSGDEALQKKLIVEKQPQTVLIGKVSAMLIWTMVDDIKKNEILQNYLSLKSGELRRFADGELIMGQSEKMADVANLVSRVAPTPTTVLLRGESGTGKEIVARAIHQLSPLRNKPLVTVNCTSFSPTLIESELFGYRKGAFTGANEDRIGLLEVADNGTIFLDEVGDMPLEMQGKLLRFLQSGEVRAVGDFTTKKVKVRVIAATNRDLEQAIQTGSFRADLFYRLNAFSINLPALRERQQDIGLLSFHFLKMASARLSREVSDISPKALEVLQNYHFPGNVRELKNIIERAVILCNHQTLEAEYLPEQLYQEIPVADILPKETTARLDLSQGLMNLKAARIEDIERQLITTYLENSNGNISHAAEMAKVPRRTFQRIMVKHQISADSYKSQLRNQ